MTTSSPRLRPLAGFGPVCACGLRLTCSWRRLLATGLPVLALCWVLGDRYVGAHHQGRPADAWLDLWMLLDQALLGYLVPLVALLTIASGLRVEMGRKTLVYHLVRPVSRTTLFLARFVSGVLPSTLLGTLALATTCLASGLAIPAALWLTLPVTAFVGAVTVGAFYYTVTTLFRGGMIIALAYTFVFESLFAGTRGAMQKASIMFHVRGVHHGLTDDLFTEQSANVLAALNPKPDLGDINWMSVSMFQELRERVAYDPPATAALVCLGIAVAALLYGAYRFSQRDFPLKD
ncbi:MAG: ABC transporter permease subunit [Planctomycetota bacterium]|nr:ABC transporter permease subunit [Planctomycetota bacterium]